MSVRVQVPPRALSFLTFLTIGRGTDESDGCTNPASGNWQVFGSRADVTDDSLERQAT